MSYLILADVSYSHFDGTPVLSGISASLTGKVGVVGQNGSGKTTLLRLLAGELQPTTGTVQRSDALSYVPQDLTLNTDDSLAGLMGIADKLAALQAIQAGSTDAADFDILAEDWDVENRALVTLQSLGLAENLGGDDALSRPVGALSGGEAMAAALAGAIVRGPAILLLDEPTNNLDSHARQWLYRAVEKWSGCLVVVSHDEELLERMDAIAELRNGGLKLYGRNFSGYLELSRAEQETEERRVAEATAKLRGEKRRNAADQTKAARSAKQGVAARDKSRFPTAAIHLRKSAAEKSAGKQRVAREARLESADAALRQAKLAARPDEHITVELPETEMPAGKIALELESAGRTFMIQGPERIALAGRNGSGKTTLLKAILGQATLPGLSVRRVIPEIGWLPQRLDYFDNTKSAIENLVVWAPYLTPNEAHAVLAQFLLKNKRAHQLAGTLSGGERLRLALACMLSTRPAPRFVLLDEPTNNLDRQSAAELAEAMNTFRGAVLAVSHDAKFLRSIGIQTTWTMNALQLV